MDDRDRQYREYLALRQKQENKGRKNSGKGEYSDSRKDSKYGEYFTQGIDKSKKAAAEREDLRENQMEEYLASREHRSSSAGNQAREDDRKHAGKKKPQAGTVIKQGRINKADKGVYPDGLRQKRRRRKSKLRTGVGIMAVLAIGTAGLMLAGLLIGIGIISSTENVKIDKNAIGIDSAVADDLKGYKNIAVLGIDARANEDDSNARSDAIIIASINEETNEIKMFSVYRDTLLDVGDQGLDKVTHAYFYGGAQQSLYALNKNLDLNIEDVVVINWKTVADTIDSVGGITIDVQESEIEEMNKYIPNTAKNVDGPDDLIEGPGKQTLNGVQAVTYSRIRKDALTGDYRRNERMKIVFSETFKKVKGAGFLKMFLVAKDVAPEIRTDMSSREIIGMMLKFKSYDMTDDTTGFPYDVGSWSGYAGAGYAWYGPPLNLANNVSKLHEQFFNQTGYTPTETVQQISNDISYKTGLY